MKHCNICGVQITPKWVIEYAPDQWLECCDRCNAGYSKCGTCANLVIHCRFATDSSPIPQTIQVTEQQGPVRMVTTKMNPERMKITCIDCPCYHNEQCGARRDYENQTCENYQVKLTPINYSE